MSEHNQPLPGQVGAVRETENKTPTLAPEPDFKLTAEVVRTVAAQPSLFNGVEGREQCKTRR